MSTDHFPFFLSGVIWRGYVPLRDGKEQQQQPGTPEFSRKQKGKTEKQQQPFYEMDKEGSEFKESCFNEEQENKREERENIEEKETRNKNKETVKESEREIADMEEDDVEMEGEDSSRYSDDSSDEKTLKGEFNNDSYSSNDDPVDSPTQPPPAVVPRETILHECMEFCSTFEDSFENVEIQRLARILKANREYSYISTLLPKSWETIVNEIMFMGK